MTNHVHPAVEEVEATRPQPVLDGPTSNAERRQLRPGDESKLASREACYRGVDSTRLTFDVYFMVKCSRVTHRPIVAGEM
jgi:hypothetical protein